MSSIESEQFGVGGRGEIFICLILIQHFILLGIEKGEAREALAEYARIFNHLLIQRSGSFVHPLARPAG